MTWARTMMDNRYACSIDTTILDKKVKAVCQTKDEIFYEIFKQIYTKKEKLENIYSTLNKLLEKLIQRLKDTNTTYEKLKGDFEFIFWNKEKKQLKMLDSTHNYEAYNINELDLSQKQNNFSASKFYPFIFIPKDEMLSKILYYQYDYGKVSPEYQRDKNTFYFTILAGERNDKFWSSSYHKMTKNLKKAYVY